MPNDVSAPESQASAVAERALLQLQKMDALGHLTGCVAHDFNNLMQIVVGNLDALILTLPEDATAHRRRAQKALEGARRAADLTQRLLAFARRQPLAPKPINVNDLIAGMSELLTRALGETVMVETVLAADVWLVESDPSQLESTLLNLALNAHDAMPDGGRLTIETHNLQLDQGYVEERGNLAPGAYVLISVADTGRGMDESVMARAFEPFFTTKEVGQGTGLGLSQVYGFLKQSNGHVKLYSEVGRGTTVKMYLPRLMKNYAAEPSTSVHPGIRRTGTETILVVEDDADVRSFSIEALRELGYRVLEAADGPGALELLGRQDSPVDLLFSDVVLPGGMNGAVLARQAVAAYPGLKVLYTTGYARNAIVHHGRLDPGVELITKPFTRHDLAARVREILDRSATAQTVQGHVIA